MAYRRGPTSIRELYEDHFHGVDGREVTVHRVVNIIEKRSHIPEMEYDRGFHEDQYGGPRHYHSDSLYQPTDHRYYDDDPNYANYHRNSSAPRNEASYYGREDLRHQLGSRSRSRARPHYRSRGRGSGPPQRDDRKDYRSSPPVVVKRDRSPVRKEAQPPVRSGSNTSSRSFSPDKDKGHAHEQTQKKHKSNVQTSQTPSSAVEETPPSSASSKEKTPASVAETEEVVVAASVEPKPTPEEDFKARRSEAIKAKALEIEKHYRQDCETFRTVVKMLVDKEPSLENLLQAPLDANLSEIKQRCLDSLKHFVKELDETVTGGGDGPSHDTPYSLSTTRVRTEEDSPQLYSTNPTSTDGEEEGRKQPGNTGDSATVPTGNQREGNQTGNRGDTAPAPEMFMPGRQEKVATHGPEDSHSEPMLSDDPVPQQDPVECFSKRLQLYNQHGVKFSNTFLSNPKTWQDITYARPGWIPDSLPFLKPGDGYWELRANSTIVSTTKPPYSKGQTRVACGVTCYDHVEGPWCEVQSQKGTRICILAAPPPTPQIPPLMGKEPP